MARIKAGLKHKFIFENSPVAIMELDYSPLARLEQQLKRQTVTNVRQYLTEHPKIVKNTFQKSRLTEANAAAMALYGVKSRGDLLCVMSNVMTTSGIDLITEQFVNLLEGSKDFSGEFKLKSAGGKFLDVFMSVSIPGDRSSRFGAVIVVLQDITIWKRIERELRKSAQLDGLTKLLNHSTITHRLEEELIRAKRYGLSLSTMMIDLDHFKIVNDKFGHQKGDQILMRVAGMIKKCFRKSDIVGRYGGDEFFVILPETKPELAKYAAQRLRRIFHETKFKSQKIISFQITVSIGIAGYPSSKIKTARDMISLSDKAMYAAKKSGRNRFSIN